MNSEGSELCSFGTPAHVLAPFPERRVTMVSALSPHRAYGALAGWVGAIALVLGLLASAYGVFSIAVSSKNYFHVCDSVAPATTGGHGVATSPHPYPVGVTCRFFDATEPPRRLLAETVVIDWHQTGWLTAGIAGILVGAILLGICVRQARRADRHGQNGAIAE